MKRPLILSIAIAFALNGGVAFALGLGPVNVKSRLNQPLVAEIPVVEGSANEANGLLVQLASPEDYDRVGLNRGRLTVPLTFVLTKDSRGQPVIRVTSEQAIREPVLDMLVEANWPKGRLLREYTMLLDPPTVAPAQTSVASQPTPSATKPLATRPAPKAEPSRPSASAARPAPVAAPSPPPRATVASKRAVSGEYGPVASGETLWDIARANRSDDSINMNRMMLAFARANPDAFINGNINALKRGAILRAPGDEDIAATGSASEAAAEVSRQAQAWRGGTATRVATSTPVSDQAAERPSLRTPKRGTASDTAAAKGGERLALVPPKTGEDSLAGGDTPGAGDRADGRAAQLRADLARTRESLSSREQESNELKARVTELEGITEKSTRLINLKDSEIAELQQRLQELQAGKSATAADTGSASESAAAQPATPVETVTTEPVQKPVTEADTVSAPVTQLADKDIWGNSATAGADKESKDADAATSAGGGDAAQDAMGEPGATGEPGASGVTDPSPVAADTESGSTDSAVVSTPANDAASATESAAPAVTTDSAQTAPVPATTLLTPPSLANGGPWYLQTWAKIAGLLAGVLLVLFGILGLRSRKPAPAPRRASIAGAFGDRTTVVTPAGAVDEVAVDETDEEALLRQVAEDPDDVGLRLELLSLYYADNNVEAFEAAASEMVEHVGVDDDMEWQQVRSMGAELAPHNPLFTELADGIDADDSEDVTVVVPRFDADGDFDAPEAPARAADDEFARSGSYATDTFDEPKSIDVDSELPAFEFDIPPLEEGPDSSEVFSFTSNAADTPLIEEQPVVDSEEDFLLGEDAIGTKLDLARAYLDMGDPDGARAMLEEVLAEGDASQQDEARKLITEIQ